MRKFTKRSAAIATAAVVAVGGAGAAYAAWLLSGGGSGAATAGTAQGLTIKDLNGNHVADDVAVSPAFFPGSTNGVAFTVENPNPFPVRITGIVLTVGDSTNESGCKANNIEVNSGAQLPAAATLVVPAKQGSVNGSSAISYAGALSMVENASDDCQAAAFPITVALAANSGTAPATGSGPANGGGVVVPPGQPGDQVDPVENQ
ncbi:hypothetical protein Q0Z83_096290 [Actinoplanes sichuanensis]|uniref:Ribosomally synthesized peptide with SipW-like signal peptide n=1 Tax=Actinoplanes sichuanensis TaxID=512349 RepID=A0ABW4ATL4_9ACTN|nr:hypothetical protein [Actinoplanes sichuanensis]BEL11438.1 hypothetical protein Q0Z83_096290 [Actinoplanes sichuanensis]